MGTLKAEAVVGKTGGDPDLDAAPGVDEQNKSRSAREIVADTGDSAAAREIDSDDISAPQGRAGRDTIKRSFVSLLQPSVSPANDDQEALRAKRRAKRKSQGQLKYVALLLVSAALLGGAVYSLSQSDRFITDLTVVGFVLVLFFLIGLRVEATQTMVRDLTDLIETGGGEFDAGPETYSDATQHKVGAMDAAVARTLSRAGELQTLLRSEDLNFEKAYSSREERFRAILEDLAVERAAITTNAENLRVAMEGAHQNLATDLNAATQKFSQLMSETSATLLARIEDQLQKQSGEAIDICVKKLRSSLDGVLIRTVEQVDARGATLAALISSKGEEFDDRLLNFKKEVALSLNGQIDDTQKAASIRIEAMAGSINRLLDRMNSGISERSESLNEMLATRVLEIANTLKAGKTEMLQTIESATELSSDISVKSAAASELLQNQVVRLNESVVMPLGTLVESLRERTSSLSQDLASQFDGVNSALKRQSNELGTLFERHIAKLNDTLVTVEGVIENNTVAQQSTLESLFKRHQRPLSEEMSAVRSEFAAQRKLLAPLISNFGRAERRSESAPAPVYTPPAPVYTPEPALSTPVGFMPEPSERQSRRLLPIGNKTFGINSDSSRAVEPSRTPASVQATEPELPRESASPSSREAEARANQSWLTDILARASSSMDEPAAVELEDDELDANIFSAISTNIESLVASDRTAAAWMAFKRREVAQFERIYTEQGEIVFSKLKTLLDADDELRAWVVKYASQFEALLKERFGDSDEKALLRYLVTPTGKVYTMLAHASNRLI